MSRSLHFSLLLLISGRVLADGHQHDKKDTVVIVENANDNHHHHHCEEKRSLKAACLQLTRAYIRPSLAVAGGALGAYVGTRPSKSKPNPTLQDAILPTVMLYSIGFTSGDIFKKICKLTMYLNSIPKK